MTLQGPNADELVNKPARLDAHGDVRFPADRFASRRGPTIGEFERLLNQKLKVYIGIRKSLLASANTRASGVVIGAVNSPGVHQIQGQKTLVEMISLAGGLRSDAGSHITMTRLVGDGPPPLLSAKKTNRASFPRRRSAYEISRPVSSHKKISW